MAPIKYILHKLHSIEKSGLALFKINQGTLPILSEIAEIIFCITATSVPNENLFSSTGLIQTDLRNHLSPSNLKNITPYKENLM